MWKNIAESTNAGIVFVQGDELQGVNKEVYSIFGIDLNSQLNRVKFKNLIEIG